MMYRLVMEDVEERFIAEIKNGGGCDSRGNYRSLFDEFELVHLV